MPVLRAGAAALAAVLVLGGVSACQPGSPTTRDQGLQPVTAPPPASSGADPTAEATDPTAEASAAQTGLPGQATASPGELEPGAVAPATIARPGYTLTPPVGWRVSTATYGQDFSLNNGPYYFQIVHLDTDVALAAAADVRAQDWQDNNAGSSQQPLDCGPVAGEAAACRQVTFVDGYLLLALVRHAETTVALELDITAKGTLEAGKEFWQSFVDNLHWA